MTISDSLCSLIMFTVGRYVGVAFLTRFPAELLIGIWSAACVVFIILATFLPGVQGLAFLMLVYFFESPLFPCLFVVSTTKLGVHTRRASSLLISAVGGGAVFPPIQGAIADRHGTRISMAVCIPCFLYISGFGFYVRS
jgi:MFS transporter, FHS family, L-fucose permease